MSTAGERFIIGTKAAWEGWKEFARTGDLKKATNKVKDTLNDYLEENNKNKH